MTKPKKYQQSIFSAIEEAAIFIGAASKMCNLGAFWFDPNVSLGERTNNFNLTLQSLRRLQDKLETFYSLVSEPDQNDLHEAFPFE